MIVKRVGILGLGLIGASLALALQEKDFCQEIWGYDIQGSTNTLAREEGIVDRIASMEEIAGETDLIILAVPVLQIPSLIKAMKPYLLEHTIVTDVGSAKAWILQELADIEGKNVHFIGGHPMAGSEKAGIQAARKDLFINAPYFLCPSTDSKEASVEILKDMIGCLGAVPQVLSAQEHDALMARISHVPYLMAASLALACGPYPGARSFAAGGFRDTTRVASCDPDMGGDFCLANKEEIQKTLKTFQKTLTDLIESMANPDEFKESLQEAKRIRDSIFRY